MILLIILTEISWCVCQPRGPWSEWTLSTTQHWRRGWR